MLFKRKLTLITSLVGPVVVVAFFSYWEMRRNTIEQTYSNYNNISSLAARILKEKLDRLKDLGTSLATRQAVRKAAEGGQWQKAIDLLSDVPSNFQYVDRIFITDTLGVLMVDVPSDTATHNKNFSGGAWFKGVSANWQPYLSEIYKRNAIPRRVIASLALPLRSQSGKVNSILVLQINTARLLEWERPGSISQSGLVCVFDQKGHVVADPGHPSIDTVIDYSDRAPVQLALKGKKDLQMLDNPQTGKKYLVAYEQVPEYKWGIIVQEEEHVALSAGKNLNHILVVYSFVALSTIFLAWLIVRLMNTRQKDQESLNQYADLTARLHASELRFRMLIENSVEGIVLMDKDFQVLYRSPSVEKITGESAEQRSKSSVALTHPEDLSQMNKKYSDVLDNPGVPQAFKGRFRHKSNNYYWAEGTLTNLLHVNGINAIVSNFRDISERKEAEDVILKLNERYDFVNHATRDAIWDWDIVMDTVAWNLGFHNLFGYGQRQQWKAQDWSDLIHPDDHERVMNEIDRSFQSQVTSWTSSYRFRNVDGHYHHVLDRAYIIYDDGKPVRMIGAMQDISDQVRAMDEVKRLSVVASATDNPVLILDNESRIEWVNASFMKLSGYTFAEVLGKKPFQFLHGSGTDRVMAKRIRETLAQGLPSSEELMNYAKDGRKYWVRVMVTPIMNEAGAIDKFVAIQSEITEQKEFEKTNRESLEKMVQERTAELNEALRKEKQLVDLKSKFVSIVSHEFRTPLSTISLAAGSLRSYFERLSKEEMIRKLIKIEDQSGHMTRLLEDLLTLGKADSGTIKVNRIHLNLKEFIESMIEEVKATFKDPRDIVFTCKLANVYSEMDDRLLRNVMSNLLTNAVKFSSPGSVVAVSLFDYENGICIEVTDEGIGIPEKELSSIFESFQRGSNVSTIQGTGLGLSILKKALELLGGGVVVKSKLGKGSTFTVQIPNL